MMGARQEGRVPKVLVLNGWAAGDETWARCTFPCDRVFSYVDQLDGLPERALAAADAVWLVGFSMGGNSALRLLLAAPEKVRGLVLVSTSPFLMEDKSVGWKGLSERRLAALRLGTRLVFEDDASPLFTDASLDRGLAYLRTSDLRAPLRAFARTLRGASVLSRLPVSVFQSERDGIVRPSNVDFLREVFPRATVTWVPGADHNLPLAIPGQIDDAVNRGLASAARADAPSAPCTPALTGFLDLVQLADHPGDVTAYRHFAMTPLAAALYPAGVPTPLDVSCEMARALAAQGLVRTLRALRARLPADSSAAWSPFTEACFADLLRAAAAFETERALDAGLSDFLAFLRTRRAAAARTATF